MLKQDFDEFRSRAIQEKKAIEKHFSRVIETIKTDFPEVIEDKSNEESKGDDDNDSSDDDPGDAIGGKLVVADGEQWTCYTCLTDNGKDQNTCISCAAPKVIDLDDLVKHTQKKKKKSE